MIKVYDFLFQRLSDYAQKYQSGLDVESSFNSKMAEVQLEVFNQFQPYYAVNEQVRVLLSPWVKSWNNYTTGFDGVVPYPTADPNDFCRVISLFVMGNNNTPIYEIAQVNENELGIIQRMPQRRPSSEKKRVYYLDTDRIQLYPQQAISISGFYFVYPTDAKIAFTYNIIDGEDVRVYDSVNSIDLQWNESAANLILYKMLEKYGVSVREDLLMQYSRLGLSNIQTKGATDGN
jgi:hypothetical protein